jgi:hypothetical protein
VKRITNCVTVRQRNVLLPWLYKVSFFKEASRDSVVSEKLILLNTRIQKRHHSVRLLSVVVYCNADQWNYAREAYQIALLACTPVRYYNPCYIIILLLLVQIVRMPKREALHDWRSDTSSARYSSIKSIVDPFFAALRLIAARLELEHPRSALLQTDCGFR